MKVTAPGPIAATAALAKLVLPLPPTGAANGAARAPDHVDLSPPPTVRTLWQLAFAGSQHLDALLPALERLLGAGYEPMPFAVGHLARAIGDAAYQIDVAHQIDAPDELDTAPLLDAAWEDLAARNDPTRPSPEALHGWRQAARTTLNDAAILLARAENRLMTPDSRAPRPNRARQDPRHALGADPTRHRTTPSRHDARQFQLPPPPPAHRQHLPPTQHTRRQHRRRSPRPNTLATPLCRRLRHLASGSSTPRLHPRPSLPLAHDRLSPKTTHRTKHQITRKPSQPSPESPFWNVSGMVSWRAFPITAAQRPPRP